MWKTLGLFKLLIVLMGYPSVARTEPRLLELQDRIRRAGEELMETYEISYVYGGYRVGDVKTCDSCNQCLEANRPQPKLRLTVCPVCNRCSLDCSHFAQMVFTKAGLPFPYITSVQLAELDSYVLGTRYQLRVVDLRSRSPMSGDLAIYRGHMGIIERIYENGRVDMIHATGGKDIREPGQGIQRERYALLQNFRGPLLRLLRHEKLDPWMPDANERIDVRTPAAASSQIHSKTPSKISRMKLRPVEKRNPAND